MVVGFINVCVVAMCIALFSDEGAPRLELFALVVFIGFLPGTLCGALLGHLAAEAKNANRRVVLTVMIALSCAAVAILGDMFSMTILIPFACVPTAAACSVLERWTRGKPDAIPLARVA
jgi:hypothetical protein